MATIRAKKRITIVVAGLIIPILLGINAASAQLYAPQPYSAQQFGGQPFGAQQYGVSSVLPTYNQSLPGQRPYYDVSHYGWYTRPDLPPRGYGNSLAPGGFVYDPRYNAGYSPGYTPGFGTNTYSNAYLEQLLGTLLYTNEPLFRPETIVMDNPEYYRPDPTSYSPNNLGRPSALYIFIFE
jgi:hypothetical protein